MANSIALNFRQSSISFQSRRTIFPLTGVPSSETDSSPARKFPRIHVVGPAKGQAVVDQESAICDVKAAHPYGKPLAKVFPDGNVEGGVTRK